MATLPSTLVQRLYQPDSLKNTEAGFELVIKNRLAPGTVTALGPLQVGDKVYDREALTLTVVRPAIRKHGRTPAPLIRAGADVSPQKTVPFALNAVAHVGVSGITLAPGRYEIVLTLRTSEVGDIVIHAVDEVPANGKPRGENREIGSES